MTRPIAFAFAVLFFWIHSNILNGEDAHTESGTPHTSQPTQGTRITKPAKKEAPKTNEHSKYYSPATNDHTVQEPEKKVIHTEPENLHGNKAPEDPHKIHPTASELIKNPNGLVRKAPWEIIMRQASVAAKTKDFELAEGLYAQALVLNPPEEAKKNGLLELAAMYEESHESTKMAAMYEKFIDNYTEDDRLVKIFMRLGDLYHEMGAYELAIARYYNVLNSSLKVDADELDAYRKVSLRAQLQIAETFFVMGDHEQARQYFKKLSRLTLSPKDEMNVLFKKSYIDYVNKDHAATAAGFREFLRRYPVSDLAPESHYILANTYNALNQPREAVSEVLKLLRKEHIMRGDSEKIWQFWRKKTANQLANQFYEDADFLSALKIYQAMAPLNNSPHWQWPVIYQIGICFERLGMLPKAHEAYSLIDTEAEWKDQDIVMTPALKSIKEMVAWRLKHMNWNQETQNRLENLLDISTRMPAITSEKTISLN